MSSDATGVSSSLPVAGLVTGSPGSGARVGSAVGGFVGAALGLLVGLVVGCWDGLRLGSVDGDEGDCGLPEVSRTRRVKRSSSSAHPIIRPAAMTPIKNNRILACFIRTPVL